MGAAVGDKFGKLTVIEVLPRHGRSYIQKVKCICACGAIVEEVNTNTLQATRRDGGTSACRECSNIARVIGDKYGKLEIADAYRNADGDLVAIARCDCGNMVTNRLVLNIRQVQYGFDRLTKLEGRAKYESSCGECILKPKSPRELYPKEYRVWSAARERCRNPKNKQYFRYGAMGVEFDSRWDDFSLFITDMGPRPSDGYELDRHPDNRGNYAYGNCRWATRIENANNMRNNVRFGFNNREMTIREISKEVGMPYGLIYSRTRRNGFTLEEAIAMGIPGRIKRS